jgi:predicted transposase/invertase (TIGR01784 family)
MAAGTRNNISAIMLLMVKDDIITPTTDLFIASLWSAPKNEPILLSLLNAVMTDVGLPTIVEAKVLNPINIQEYPTDKQIRLDVLVEDEAKARYNIEVQANSHTSFFDRMLYYWAETYGSLLELGEKYKRLRPVRSIVITEFPVFPELRDLHTVFEIRARENPAVLLSGHFQMHVLRLGDWLRNNRSGLDSLCVGLQRWMQFWGFGFETEVKKMSTMLQDAPEVLSAYEEYRRFSADSEMRAKARAQKHFLDEQAIIMNDVREEGEAKGRTKEKFATAIAMKKKGYPVTDIAEITGLSPSEIERLG